MMIKFISDYSRGTPKHHAVNRQLSAVNSLKTRFRNTSYITGTMRIYGYAIYLSVFSLPFPGAAQAIDNTVSFRNINSDQYTRIYYENDFFTGTDRDYTQGIYIERITPSLRHFP